MPHERTEHIATKYLASFLVALVALSAVIGAGYWYLLSTPAPREEASRDVVFDAARAAQAFDLETAVELAREAFAHSGTSDPYRPWAAKLLAESLKNSATSSARLVESVQVLKQSFAEASTQYERASLVNSIAALVQESKHPAVFEEAFKDPPFAALKVEGNPAASFRRLVEYSLGIVPTFDAHMLIARDAADAILLELEPGSTRLVSTSASSTERVQFFLRRIERSARLAQEFAARDQQIASTSPYGITVRPWQRFWTGFVYAAAARVEAAHLSEAEAALTDAARAYDDIRDANGDGYPMLAQIKARAELAHARSLAAVEGSARSADIRTHLDSFTNLLLQSPNQFASFYRFFDGVARRISRGAVTESDDRLYEEYTNLAAYSPTFSEFLKARGWDL